MRVQRKTPLADFLSKSRSRYKRMKHESIMQGWNEAPYSLIDFRNWLIEQLGGMQGTARCEYCNAVVDIHTLEIDHRLPVVQGGTMEFMNLAISCKCCNQQKGGMRAPAFIRLLQLANDTATCNEIDRTDLLGRLQSALKLALLAQKQARGASKQPPAAVRVMPHVRLARKAANGD